MVKIIRQDDSISDLAQTGGFEGNIWNEDLKNGKHLLGQGNGYAYTQFLHVGKLEYPVFPGFSVTPENFWT